MKHFFTFLLLFLTFYSKVFAIDDPSIIKEQVAQIMVVHIKGSELNDQLKSFFSKVPVGGVILYPWANGLDDSQETKKLCRDIKDYFKQMNKPAPWFFIDEEGGSVSRLKFGDKAPSAKEVGLNQTLTQAYATASVIAKKLNDHGIEVNLAPVVDIPSVDAFAYKTRVFSDDANVVTNFANCYLEAFKEHHVMGCLKHFPGHGRAKSDSHNELPIIEASYDELWNLDWIPYKKLKNKASFVMTAHLLVPSLDDKPATISRKIVTDILKEKLGYEGLVLSDSLMMKGILSIEPNISELAFKAFKAGHDMLLFGGSWLIKGEIDFELGSENLISINENLTDMFLNNPKAYKDLQKVYDRIIEMKKVLKI